MYKILRCYTLLALVLPLLLSSAPYRQKVSSNRKGGMKYLGPVIYANEQPPVLHFPPPLHLPKGPYRPPVQPIKFVPLPYNELPILIYQSKENPPIHVVESPLISDHSVGESSPHHKEYSAKRGKPGSSGDLYPRASEVKFTRTVPWRSPVRTAPRRRPTYLRTLTSKPVYVSSKGYTRHTPRYRGVYPPGVIHGPPKLEAAPNLEVSGSEISINSLPHPNLQVLSKRYTRPAISRLHDNEYLGFGSLLSNLLGGLTSTSYSINKLLGIHFHTTPHPSVKHKVKEYHLRNALGLGQPSLNFLTGYGNQAIDPEYQALLSDEITHSFIDEVANYGSHGMVKYKPKVVEPDVTEKPEDPEEEDEKPQSEEPSTETTSTTTTDATTTSTSYSIPATTTSTSYSIPATATSTSYSIPTIADTKPPMANLQSLHPSVYAYKKPEEDFDNKAIISPVPRFHQLEDSREESIPIYKSPPYRKLNFPTEKGRNSVKTSDDDETLVISPSGIEEPWKPITQPPAIGTATTVDLKNHRVTGA